MQRHVRILFLLVILFKLQLSGLGQVNDTSRLIIVTENNPTIRTLLGLIRNQAGISFGYSNAAIQDQETIKLPGIPISAGRILQRINETCNTSYIIYGDFIVFRKKIQLADHGLVHDEENHPLPGVLIHYPGSGDSSKTDQHGRFNLSPDSRGKPFDCYLEGYELLKTETSGHQLIVRMKRANRDLQEVMVMGYSSTPKWKNTAGIDRIDGLTAAVNFNKNIILTIQGKVPGLLITDANGAPGSSSRIQIRGQQSIGIIPGASYLPANNPLILVNKVIWAPSNQSLNKLSSMSGDPETSGSRRGVSGLNAINMDDVAHIFVYKDADATAIFGSQGANGVISIITRKGNNNAPVKYSLNASQGVAISAFRPQLMNTEQYATMRREYMDNSIISENKYKAPDLVQWPLNRFTDWSKFLLGNTARTQQYHFSASGGNAQFSFYGSAGLQQETTVLPVSFTNRNSSFHLNTTFSPGKRSSTQFSVYVSHSRNQQPVIDPMPLIYLSPNAPSPIDGNGKLVYEENGLATPNIVAQLNNRHHSNTLTVLGNLYSEYALTPKLLLKMRLGISDIDLDERSIFPIMGQPSPDITGFTENAHTHWQSITVEPQLQYLDTFANKTTSFLFTAGTTWQIQKEKWETISRKGYTNDWQLGDPNFASETDHQKDKTDYRYKGFYAVTNYAWQNKIIVNITSRVDGSSRIGNKRRYAVFGALGAGWVFSNMEWMNKYSGLINFGKLRASIGTTGNDNAGKYNYYSNYQLTPGNNPVSPASTTNPALGWEQTLKKEIALDLQFLKRISLSLAWYHNVTTDQLIAVPMQGQDADNYPYAQNHDARVINSGLEFSLESNWRIRQNAKLNTELTLTIPRNKLHSFKDLETSLYKNSLIMGKSLTEARGFIVDRVDPISGRYTFKDLSGDGRINTEDQAPIGNLDPVIYGGFTSKLNINQWEISVFVEGRQQKAINPMVYGLVRQPGSYQPDLRTNQSTAFLQRWSKPGDIAGLQQFSAAAYKSLLRELLSSNQMLTDASYLRVRNISVSWTGLSKWLNKFDLKQIKLYARLFNLLTITKYKGGDPTIQYPMEVPSLRSFMVGIEIRL